MLRSPNNACHSSQPNLSNIEPEDISAFINARKRKKTFTQEELLEDKHLNSALMKMKSDESMNR